MAQNTPNVPEGLVRKPFVADQFYPGDKTELNNMINAYLTKASVPAINGPLKALVVPHAGYIYSGEIAAYGFKLVDDKVKKVVILGANHNPRAGYFKFSLPNEDFYETPIGKVRISPIVKELRSNKLFTTDTQANLSHIIEVEIPFLQSRLGEFEITPIVIGGANGEELMQLADILSDYLDEETLLVVSSDLSHYNPYDQAIAKDKATIGAVEKLDFAVAQFGDACGLPAILVLMKIAQDKGWQGKILDYRNSGDTAGDKSKVVGYSSIAFYEGKFAELTESDKQYLLKFARETIETYVKTKKKPEVNEAELSRVMLTNRACFVTLNKHGQLRGCIGDLQAYRPLYESVLNNAIAAASTDPRFSPVTEAELKDIEIEISALTVPKSYKNEGPEKFLAFLTPGKHGLILSQRGRRATFLPQVWESLPRKEDFLAHLCMKAGLAADCWKQSDTQFQIYEVVSFEEKK
ncbi:MAG: AmmeMemoRadiSam system protein B [Deltaproteobacteria bacterium]|nr:AmmeMemoRadiSam system protein B [Deltaproteobacteria bacterium]